MRDDPTYDEVRVAFRHADDPPELQSGHDHRVRFALIHPQWGGYCFPCAVEFQRPPEEIEPWNRRETACFDVYEFHDTEFPQKHLTGLRHYCCPLQVVRFGVDVLELQAKAGYEPGRGPREQIEKLANRLLALTMDTEAGAL